MSGASSHTWPGDLPPRPYIMPDAGREAPGVSVIEGPPCSWEPSRSPPFWAETALLSHDAPGHSGKLPPKRPWQSSARNKVRGGTFVWPEQRAGRCWQSSATIRPGPFHRPSSADLELPRGPRAGSTAAGPRAVQTTSSYPQQPAGPRGQTGAPPCGPRADPQHLIPRARTQATGWS